MWVRNRLSELGFWRSRSAGLPLYWPLQLLNRTSRSSGLLQGGPVAELGREGWLLTGPYGPGLL